MKIRVIEKATGVEYLSEPIEGGFKLFTISGEPYKKLKDSTFKRYFKKVPASNGNSANFDESDNKQYKSHKQEQNSSKDENTTNLDDKRQVMIDKVKKLLTLSENNPSEEEAISAALMAQKLMAKYNIHEDDVALEEIKEDITSIFTDQKKNSSLHSWRKHLATIVSKSFRCKCYMKGKDVVFRGFTDDAKLAHDTYIMLYTVGDKLGSKAYNQALKETGSGNGIYNSFVTGFLKGIQESLDKQCTALLVITPKQVEEEWVQFSANFKAGKATHLKIKDIEAFQNGYAEGKNAVNSRSIERKGTK